MVVPVFGATNTDAELKWDGCTATPVSPEEFEGGILSTGINGG
jgi:hypothetical protein